MAPAWKETKKIDTSMMRYDDYQRPLNDAWVNQIVRDWNEVQANLPKVSSRGGAYYVFDGQHTIAARIARNNGRDLLIPCEVYHNLTKKDEAQLFASLNKQRKQVRRADLAKAEYIAGKKEVVDLVNIVKQSGYNISFSGFAQNGEITAIAQLQGIYKKGGPEAIKSILSIISGTWSDDRDSLRAEILGGVYEFWDAFRDDYAYNVKTFSKRLSNVSPKAIIREGKELSVGANRRFAKRLVYYYNKGTRGSANRLDVSKLD